MKINALQVRQEFGKILKLLHESQQPLVIEKSRKPVAVLISIEDFEKRFLDKQQEEKKLALLKAFKENLKTSKKDSLQVLRSLRYD